MLASTNSRSANVCVLVVIIAKLELGNIERHVVPAHFVERADHSALEDGPEAFDGLSMDFADNILSLGMLNGGVREVFAKAIIACPFVGAKQTNFVRDGLTNEGFQRSGLDVLNHASNNVSLAADSTNDWRFAGTDTASSATATALVLMLVFGQAADESFIDFDNSAELPS